MWENYGLIFSNSDLKKIDSDLFFAKSPQLSVVRGCPVFFFTSQKKDKYGKWVSLPYWVKFDSSFKNILSYSKNPTVEKGSLGSFDEHGIFPFSPTKTCEGYFAYTTGWSRRKSVDIEMSIGLCESSDGLNFRKVSTGPIMTSSLKEPFLVGDAFVKQYKSTFYMWYIFGDQWLNSANSLKPERRYKISQATSVDGLHWSRNSHYIIAVNSETECQALPSVTYFKNRYHMAFCYRDVFNFRNSGKNAYKLGYAHSIDLLNWIRKDNFIHSISSRKTWDSSMQCYPNLFVLDGNMYCAYNGNEFGKRGFGLARLL